MTAQSSHVELLDFMRTAEYTNLVVGSSLGNAPVDLTLERVNIDEDVAQEFFEIGDGAASKDGDRELRPYDPGYILTGPEIFFISTEDDARNAADGRSEIDRVVQAILPVNRLAAFAGDEAMIDGFRFYAIVVSDRQRRTAVFFRTYSPRGELTRSKRLALIGARGQYDFVDTPIFTFDPMVDCYWWDGYLYVRNVTSFQRMFGYFERLRLRVDEVLAQVQRRIPVRNFDEFATACRSQQQMMAKLAQIAQKDYFDRIGVGDIERTINEFGLNVAIVEENGQRELVFEGAPAKRWLILKLLDDDFLGSVMTDEKYEVNSKLAL
jgi:hypothetical protein